MNTGTTRGKTAIAIVVTTLLAACGACGKSDEDRPPTSSGPGTSPTTGGGSSGRGDSSAPAPDGGASREDGGGDGGDEAGAFALTSTAFAEDGTIPRANAKCPDGASNQSPPLSWGPAPEGAQSYAVVMRDLDVAEPNNYHWVLWDIPGSVTSLPQGIAAQASPPTPSGAKQTHWSFSADYSYQGPCPPNSHRYRFTVYAFTLATLPITAGETSPNAVDAVIQANATASASLTGNYER